MPVIIVTFAAWLSALLTAGLAIPAQAQTTVIVPRTTITVDEQPQVVQPTPFGPAAPAPTPTPEQRRRRDAQAQQQARPTLDAAPAPVVAPAPARPRPQGPRRPANGYSSFLTGPIDLTRPPVPQH
jgi:hypothetical protein